MGCSGGQLVCICSHDSHSKSIEFKMAVVLPKRPIDGKSKNVLFSCLNKVDFPSGKNVSFSLSQRAKDQASHLPTKSLKEQTKTCLGQAKYDTCSKGKLYRTGNKQLTKIKHAVKKGYQACCCVEHLVERVANESVT